MPTRIAEAKLDGHATNRRLHDSAVQLFARRGYSATTTRQIAAGAGVTVGSLYNHVASKQDLLFEVMRRTHEQALSRLDGALDMALEPVSALRAAVRAHVLFHTDYGAPIAVTYQEMRALDAKNRQAIATIRDQYGQRFKTIIRQGIDDGVFATATPDLAVLAILTMGTQVSSWFKKRDADSAGRVADAYAEFALRMVGCRTEPKSTNSSGSSSTRNPVRPRSNRPDRRGVS
jgi:AcrR family transcriptional regulator